MPKRTVSTNDPDWHEPQRTLAAIDDRLAQHEQATRTVLTVCLLMAAVALAMILNAIPHCVTLVGQLLRSLP
jgi:hypothetical protein